MSSLPLLALAMLAPQEGESTTSPTGHFEVICHWDSERAEEESTEVVEQVSIVAGQIYDLSGLDLEQRLQVHLYPDQQTYEAVDQELTGGSFKQNGAFSHFDSKSAHVALQPEISAAVLERGGLPVQTRRMLAHEAAHLLRYALFNQHRSHPRWFVDGAASWIDQEVMTALELSAGLEKDPFTATAIVRVQALVKKKRLPPVEKLLGNEFGKLDFYECYDYSELFFRFLIEGEQRELLGELINGPLRQLGGGKDFAKRLRAEFKKLLGKVSLRKLDKDFRVYLGTLHADWRETYRSLETHGDEWRQLAFASKNAMALRMEDIKEKKYEITGSFEILEGGRHQLNILLDRNDSGFVSLAFAPGALTIFHYHARKNEWEQLLERKVEGLGINVAYEFRVAVTGNRLQVFLRGKELAKLTVKGRKLHGPWGLGVQAGGVGLWQGLKGPGLD